MLLSAISKAYRRIYSSTYLILLIASTSPKTSRRKMLDIPGTILFPFPQTDHHTLLSVVAQSQSSQDSHLLRQLVSRSDNILQHIQHFITTIIALFMNNRFQENVWLPMVPPFFIQWIKSMVNYVSFNNTYLLPQPIQLTTWASN